MTKHTAHSDSHNIGKLETRDANFKNVMFSGLGLLGILVLGFVISWGVYSVFVEKAEVPGTAPETFTQPTGTLPPGPNLQTDPHSVLVAMRKAEDSVLTSYGWVNRESGIVRFPIERAVEILAQQGLPSRADESSKK